MNGRHCPSQSISNSRTTAEPPLSRGLHWPTRSVSQLSCQKQLQSGQQLSRRWPRPGRPFPRLFGVCGQSFRRPQQLNRGAAVICDKRQVESVLRAHQRIGQHGIPLQPPFLLLWHPFQLTGAPCQPFWSLAHLEHVQLPQLRPSQRLDAMRLPQLEHMRPKNAARLFVDGRRVRDLPQSIVERALGNVQCDSAGTVSQSAAVMRPSNPQSQCAGLTKPT